MAPQVEFKVLAISGQTRVKSFSFDESFNQEAQTSVEHYGEVTPFDARLQLYQNDTLILELLRILSGPTTGGISPTLGRYTGRGNVSKFLGHVVVRPVPVGHRFRRDSSLEDAYGLFPPSSAPAGSSEDMARTALAKEGISLVVHDGPGIWRGAPPAVTEYQHTDTMSFLQSTLLATGARWWLDHDTLYIDGNHVARHFGLPLTDYHLITDYTYVDDIPPEEIPEAPATPEEELPPEDPVVELPEEPVEEDYLSRCPDYSGNPPEWVPPEPREEPLANGRVSTIMHGGSKGDPVTVTRSALYSKGILLETETTEEGMVDTPSGKVFKLKARSLTRISPHPLCPQAILQQTDKTFVVPELTTAGNTQPELALELYNALLAKTNEVTGLYLQSSRQEDFYYHAEGWLRKSIETNRELNALQYRPIGNTDFDIDIDLSYSTRVKTVVNEPLGRGLWAKYTLERQSENTVVYEVFPGSEGDADTSTPATVQRTSRSTPTVDIDTSSPGQLNCPAPEAPKPGVGYFWTFGDGTERQSDSTTFHTYNNPGVYSVSVLLTKSTGVTYDASGSIDTIQGTEEGSDGILKLDIRSSPGPTSLGYYFDASRRVIGCLEEEQENFQEDHDEWEEEVAEIIEEAISVQANQYPKRVHTITFGMARPNFRINQLYGNGLIAGVSHSYSDDGESVTSSTTLQVWQRLA